MTTEKLKEAHEAQPFEPFILHLADGREIPVRHREFMARSPSGRTVIIYQADDSHNVIDLLLVTDIEFKANGHRKNGRGSKRS